MPDFLTLGIQSNIVQLLKANGLSEPTPIQEKAIPVVLRGKDVIAQAQTGTGKTLAFILPIIQKVDPQNSDIQALIITPTRELALQITTEVKKLLTNLGSIQVLAVYGGQDVEQQMRRLQGSRQIVIGTPGRLLDHLRRGTLQLNKVSKLVLDEADQMLHMGFLKEVEEIIRNTSPTRQTLLFSATMPQQIRSLAVRFMRNPEDIRISTTKTITVKDIKQIVVETTDRLKQSTLRNLLERYRPFLAIIFCRTKRRASTLNQALQEQGYDADELHGDLSQAKREQVLKRFREAKIQLLVATDVAARGLDVEGVTHVFNYDIPQDVESYIHRIGRTGRAGEAGLAITLVAPKDRLNLAMIEKGLRQSLEKQRLEVKQAQADNRSPGSSVEKKRESKRKQSNRPQRGRANGEQVKGKQHPQSKTRGKQTTSSSRNQRRSSRGR